MIDLTTNAKWELEKGTFGVRRGPFPRDKGEEQGYSLLVHDMKVTLLLSLHCDAPLLGALRCFDFGEANEEGGWRLK